MRSMGGVLLWDLGLEDHVLTVKLVFRANQFTVLLVRLELIAQ